MIEFAEDKKSRFQKEELLGNRIAKQNLKDQKVKVAFIAVFFIIVHVAIFSQTTTIESKAVDKPLFAENSEQYKKILKAIAPYSKEAKKTYLTAKNKFLKGLDFRPL